MLTQGVTEIKSEPQLLSSEILSIPFSETKTGTEGLNNFSSKLMLENYKKY